MNFPVATSQQLQAVIRALRRARSLSQQELGALMHVNQKRIARIESQPGVTSYDQVARLISALGGRLVVEELNQEARKPEKNSRSKGDW